MIVSHFMHGLIRNVRVEHQGEHCVLVVTRSEQIRGAGWNADLVGPPSFTRSVDPQTGWSTIIHDRCSLRYRICYHRNTPDSDDLAILLEADRDWRFTFDSRPRERSVR